jgi:hypothetical protein
MCTDIVDFLAPYPTVEVPEQCLKILCNLPADSAVISYGFIPTTAAEKTTSWGGLFQGGIDLRFYVSKKVSLLVESQNGVMIGKKGINQFISISPGVQFNF